MPILSRYIFRELLPPTLLGFGFYTFIILMRDLFDFAEIIIKRSLPLSTVLELLALSLPNITVLTIPMALLVGILVAVGRLSADSEIIAMQASGQSPLAIYRPVFFFSVAIFLLNFFLITWVLPLGNAALQQRRVELFTSAIEKEVQPRVFFNDNGRRVIYVNDIDGATGLWQGIFLAESSAGQQRIVTAETGGLLSTEGTRQVWLNLDRAQTHVISTRRSDRYDLNRNASQRILLIDPASVPVEPKSRAKSLKELDLQALWARLQDARIRGDALDQRFIKVELHLRFAIPFACIAFGIIGLPLGITNRRGGKSSGFSLSIGIILLYYILLSTGEDFARSGKVPPFIGMWLANALLAGSGLWLMAKSSGSRGPAGWMARLARLGTKLARRRQAAEAPVQSEGSILQRLDIPFPNTLDRYVIREFIKLLLLVVAATAMLFIVVDLTDTVDDINANEVPFDVVASYYRYLLLQVMNLVLPISVLIATLITFGALSKNNEVTAIKANGVSLYRIALPVVAIAIVVAIFSYFFQDFVLPYSNQRVAELRSRIKGRVTPSAVSEDERQWVFGKGRYIFSFLAYEDRTKTLSDVQVLEFHPEDFRMTRRIAAEEARFDGTGWVFFNGWMRSFGDDGGSSYTPIERPVRLHYSERPAYFQVEAKLPDQMTWSELRRYVQNLKRLGYAAHEPTVRLWEKTSWPFISVIMALIALPFSFKMGKKGAMYGIGIALFLAFVYWVLFGLFTKLGEVGSLPAVLAAWSANILFGLAALYLFLRVET
jgi:LPS export ABC transporter permease LptG/LPS export ABC transporter permease LptF